MIIETTTTDDLLNRLTEIRNSLKALQESERDLKRTKNDLESRIIANLERQGIDRVGNGSCTAWHPHDDNEVALGDSSYLFTAVYATNGTIQTSDRNRKENIIDSTLGLNFLNQFLVFLKKFKFF